MPNLNQSKINKVLKNNKLNIFGNRKCKIYIQINLKLNYILKMKLKHTSFRKLIAMHNIRTNISFGRNDKRNFGQWTAPPESIRNAVEHIVFEWWTFDGFCKIINITFFKNIIFRFEIKIIFSKMFNKLNFKIKYKSYSYLYYLYLPRTREYAVCQFPVQCWCESTSMPLPRCARNVQNSDDVLRKSI